METTHQPQPINNPYAAPGSSIGTAGIGMAPEVRDARLRQVVGDNYEIYRERWHLDSPEAMTSRPWHWPAFLFPYYWLLFRKMYLMAGIALACTMGIGFAVGVFRLPLWLLLLTLLMNLGFGLIGNALYLRHCTRLIEQMERVHRGAEHRILAELGRRGGTSYVALVAGLAGMAMLRFLVFFR